MPNPAPSAPNPTKQRNICIMIYSLFIYFFNNFSVPSEPVGLHTADQTDTSLTLSWRVPLSPNGIISEYKLKYFPPTACLQNGGDQSDLVSVCI